MIQHFEGPKLALSLGPASPPVLSKIPDQQVNILGPILGPGILGHGQGPTCPLGPIQNSRLISQNGSPNLALEYQALANQNKSRYCSVQLENCMFKNFDQVFCVMLL